jgi:hypothetical protein
MNFAGAQKYILGRLEKELHKNLYYHRIEHTIDIHQAALRLIQMENTDPHSSKLIETAALFHDAGMIYTYNDHELASVEIVKESLPAFDYSREDIVEISELILVTKMPQHALTINQMILCDADLDSLGREDFFVNSLQLQLEWKLFDVLDTSLFEWFQFEIKFMENHSYYTPSSQQLRDAQKLQNLMELKSFFAH